MGNYLKKYKQLQKSAATITEVLIVYCENNEIKTKRGHADWMKKMDNIVDTRRRYPNGMELWDNCITASKAKQKFLASKQYEQSKAEVLAKRFHGDAKRNPQKVKKRKKHGKSKKNLRYLNFQDEVNNDTHD